MKKFIEFKNKWSGKLPTFATNTQKHLFVVFALSVIPTIVGSFPKMAIYGLRAIVLIFIGCIAWEVLGFIEKGFNDKTRADAIKDLAAAFAALFLQFVTLIINHTT